MKRSFLLTVSLCLGAASIAVAASPAEQVKIRQKFMDGLGAHMAVIGMSMKMQLKDADLIAGQAQAIHDVAAKLPAMFPEGSTSSKSKVKPDVWKNWKDFEAKAKNLETASAALADAAKSKDFAKIGPAIGKLGDSCKDCHKAFKEPEKDEK